jgi:hypothetical protein
MFDVFRPIHAVGLVAIGLWLIDNMELTELAEGARSGSNGSFSSPCSLGEWSE